MRGYYKVKSDSGKDAPPTSGSPPEDIASLKVRKWAWSKRKELEWKDDVSDFLCGSCGQLLVYHFTGSDGLKFCPGCRKNMEENNNGGPLLKSLAYFCKRLFKKKVEFGELVETKLYEMRAHCFNRKEGCSFSGQLHELKEHSKCCKFDSENAAANKLLASFFFTNQKKMAVVGDDFVTEPSEESKKRLDEEMDKWLEELKVKSRGNRSYYSFRYSKGLGWSKGRWREFWDNSDEDVQAYINGLVKMVTRLPPVDKRTEKMKEFATLVDAWANKNAKFAVVVAPAGVDRKIKRIKNF